MTTATRVKKEKKARGRPLANLADQDRYPSGTFGRLQPLDYYREVDEHGSRIYWRCRCACGNKANVWVRSSHLNAKIGGVKSCGCLRSDIGKVLMSELHLRRQKSS